MTRRIIVPILVALAFLGGCSTTRTEVTVADANDQKPAAPAATPAVLRSADIQKLLDAAAGKGGTVRLEARRYLLDAPINIPEGVALAGVWEAPHHAQLLRGTVFEVTAGKGDEAGTPLVSLHASSTIRGISFYYPDQRVPDAIAYPWTIQGEGMHGSVIDCTFVNAYKAIDFGTHMNELHYIRNCYGCPLKVGIHIDQCTDIGRIENVHFNPHYWARAEVDNKPQWPALRQYLWENLTAFEFGRTDWEYVLNTFCFGAKIGYRFYDNGGLRMKGTVNGNFLGIGADWCHRAIVVEACQMPGLLITNGEFVGGEGSEAFMEVMATNRGPVNLANCSFWGPSPQIAVLHGESATSFQQCNFLNQGPIKEGMYTITADRGDLSVQNCRFEIDCPDVRLRKGVRSAIILGNWFRGSKEIANAAKVDVQDVANVVVRPATRPAK